MNDTYLSMKEAAALLGCSKSTVWRYVNNGALPVRSFGRGVRISKKRVEELKEKLKAIKGNFRSIDG